MQEENWKELSSKIPRGVILDLLPLYTSGEASEETCALISRYLNRDTALRSQVEQAQAYGLDLVKNAGPQLSPGLELRALRRTRALLRWQRITYGWALALTVASLGGVGFLRDGHVAFHFFFREYPQVFFPCLSLAVSLWINYLVLRWLWRATKL